MLKSEAFSGTTRRAPISRSVWFALAKQAPFLDFPPDLPVRQHVQIWYVSLAAVDRLPSPTVCLTDTMAAKKIRCGSLPEGILAERVERERDESRGVVSGWLLAFPKVNRDGISLGVLDVFQFDTGPSRRCGRARNYAGSRQKFFQHGVA
jgi:hypothetical protein